MKANGLLRGYTICFRDYLEDLKGVLLHCVAYNCLQNMEWPKTKASHDPVSEDMAQYLLNIYLSTPSIINSVFTNYCAVSSFQFTSWASNNDTHRVEGREEGTEGDSHGGRYVSINLQQAQKGNKTVVHPNYWLKSSYQDLSVHLIEMTALTLLIVMPCLKSQSKELRLKC